MKTSFIIAALLLALPVVHMEARELFLSLNDTFTVTNTAKWTVSVLNQVDLRSADIEVKPRGKKSFYLTLYFKCDTKDLAQYDTPEKMKKSVIETSQKYLGVVVEKEIAVEAITNRGWYGFKTTLTDAALAGTRPPPDGQFLYMIRGMIRLSEDSALGFNLMTNDPNSGETREIEQYICAFARMKRTS